MAVPPLQIAGAPVASGALSSMTPPNIQSFGGTRVFNAFSGKAGDAVTIWSGTGILNTVYSFAGIQSGLTTTLIDAASTAVVSGFGIMGGTLNFISDSGMKVLGVVPPTYDGRLVSGSAIGSPQEYLRPIAYGAPFYSGLCFAGTSGQPGFGCTFTPLSNPS